MSYSKDDQNKKKSVQDADPDFNEETKTFGPDFTGSKPGSHHPKKIGRYSIKRVIASGGMGTVYEGVQENPRRSVAVKVIKGNDVSEKEISRLKYEAQMLARLRHPGIAEIYEAGTYEEHGITVPFFAMEYIPNAKKITEYANLRKLSVDERLRLFIQLCDAVNYGHQRGIVHRDLKPDNILVDSHNRVRIIDFGLARATDSDLRQTNVQTEVGQIIGSLQYMSPEQFEADSRDLDTRSDVYSLGVVLYELLSGTLPYDLNSKKVYEIASIVREKQPLTLNKSGIKVAAEIDIILQKCLRKERELRYQTAYGLQQDISRFLSGDAIVARSPSLAYQIKVFARKNKLLVGSFSAIFVLLVAGTIVSTSLLVQVSHERERALLESEKVKKANVFLASIFEKAVPDGFGKPVPISQLLDNSTKMLEGAFPNDPEIEADIRHSLGLSYFFCEEYEESQANLSRARELRKDVLGEVHPKTRKTLEDLNWVNSITGSYQDYLVNCLEMCRIDSLKYGSCDQNTLSSRLSVAYSLGNLGEIPEALEIVRKVKETFLSENPDNVKMGNEIDQYMSWFLLQSGQMEEAERIAKENYELATTRIEDDSYVRDSKSILAATLISNGKLDEAVELYGSFPSYPGLDKEYSIQGNLNPDESGVLLIAFWEEWCPFCDRMMRKLENLYRQYHNYGIDIIGVTSLSNKSTKKDCEDFLKKNNISFPIIKEGGKALDYFNAREVPSIRLVYKGNLIWDKRAPSVEPISRHMLEGIIKALQS